MATRKLPPDKEGITGRACNALSGDFALKGVTTGHEVSEQSRRGPGQRKGPEFRADFPQRHGAQESVISGDNLGELKNPKLGL